ncbi:glycosyl transferase [Prauserella marina]|uniref:Glycosyltransferase, GT2 family n=1 Tax=Prauserella marina TaxID=530584 RepID=A0A222VW34_9PSEU|nr:glycosyltransferase family 2 protein [Prauserella marina]ASR37933.1 glycosyl transferase [Prauserella marina]PWV73142.1 GT2 family glycosyltransferase [Prauserella marina]SDD70838.1 Glycosyltransferase, GT2 family [Prauserella marina]
MPRTPTPPSVTTAPVLAILVCHNGQEWLPLVLSALRRSTIRPRHVLAVDTGSTDGTPELLAEAARFGGVAGEPVLDGVITVEHDTGFASAVAFAVEAAIQRWGDPGQWIWLLHDDSAPEPDCLDGLLRTAEAAPSAAVLGPLAVDWSDPRLIVEAGISTDASGHRQPVAPRWSGADGSGQSTEVLAVPSAGSLILREAWEELGGYDTGIALLREDIDFGWRVNAREKTVLCVPAARLRHARAVSTGQRAADAVAGGAVASADREYGLRTFLVNCSAVSFVLGLPRLVVLCVLRGIGFVLLRNGNRARAEFTAAGRLLGSTARLREARSARSGGGAVSGLLTSRWSRLSATVRDGVLLLVRKRVASEAALGRLPEAAEDTSAWIPPEARDSRPRPVGPDALPAGALRSLGSRGAGLRRPGVVAVSLPGPARTETEIDGARDLANTGGDPGGVAGGAALAGEESEAATVVLPRRPSPGPSAARGRDLVFVEVDRRRMLAATVLAPPVVLAVLLAVVGLLVNSGRLGFDLAGGALLPVGDLGEVWSAYFAAWHPVSGGTASAAPAALAVLGLAGAPFAPLGGPAALVAILLIGQIPLAALVAYAATRKLRVDRWMRAGVAAAYALLPAGTAAAAQGRLDVVVVHILLPALIASVVSVLTSTGTRWLSGSVLCALLLAVTGAFAPLVSLLALLVLVVGFVVMPMAKPTSGILALAIVVLLPVALLLPWLPALLADPGLLLHGIGGPSASPTAAELAGLDPGGPGVPPLGVVLVLVAFVAGILRPSRRLVPGLVMFGLGVAALVATLLVEVHPVAGGSAATGFAGVPLLLVGAGLLAVVLGLGVAGKPVLPGLPGRAGVVLGVAVLVALAAGGVVTRGEGQVRAGGGERLAPSLTAELADTGRGVLVLGDDDTDEVSLSGGRLPLFGDDAIAPVPGAYERLAQWRDGLLAGSREAVTSAAAAGVLFVVLPGGEDGAEVSAAAPDLVAPAPPTSEGNAVLRLTATTGQVTVVAPEQARRAVSGEPPSGDLMSGDSVAAVKAQLPDVHVRVSDGPDGRLLVLASAYEPGWRATLDGKEVPIVPAWGHQVAVSVPPSQSDVQVEYPSTLRNVLLLGQVAALLFAVLTAIPGRGGARTTTRRR